MNESRIIQAYTGASGMFVGRFQSIGIISGNTDGIGELRECLKDILSDEGKYEIKFRDVNRYYSTGYKTAKRFYIKAIEDFSATNRMRADILTWDSAD